MLLSKMLTFKHKACKISCIRSSEYTESHTSSNQSPKLYYYRITFLLNSFKRWLCCSPESQAYFLHREKKELRNNVIKYLKRLSDSILFILCYSLSYFLSWQAKNFVFYHKSRVLQDSIT